MDPTGGTNPSEPKPNTVPTPNSVNDVTAPTPSPAEINPTLSDSPNVTAPQQGSSLNDFKFEEPNASTPQPAVNPVVGGGSGPVINQTVKPNVKAPKVKQPGKGGFAKKALLFLLVLILMAGAGAGGYFYGLSEGKKQGDIDIQEDQITQVQRGEEEEAEDGSGELVLGELREPVYADETLTAEIGKQVEANDGLVLKVVSVDRNFQTTDPNYKIETGKELIKVNVALGNIAKDKAKDITPSSFRLVNSAGTQLTAEVISSYEGKFETLKIEPGKQTTGSIVYKVEKDEKPLSLVREQRYRIATDNKEVTTKITVTLTK
jgi:hypothetical protein